MINKESIMKVREDFNKRLKEIEFEKQAFSKKISNLILEEDQIKDALRGLSPFFDLDIVEELNKNVVRKFYTQSELKEKILKIIHDNPRSKYTTPELLDMIYTKEGLDKKQRRKLIMTLSVALINLKKEQRISTKKSLGRGNSYFFMDYNKFSSTI